MSPGMSTRPPQSMVSPSVATALPPDATDLMAAPSTTTVRPFRSASDLPSKTRALMNATCAARAGEPGETAPDPAANA